MDVRQAGGGGVVHCLVSWGTRLRVLARGQSPCSVREPALVSATIESLEDRRLLSFTPPADPRVITNLDSDWKFLRADASNAQTVGFNDSSWSDVNVPHTWNDLDGQDGGNDYYRGIGWYRKHITPAASLSGKSMYLKFDGANITTDLWVNGNYLGQHKGGYSAFGWDVSQHLTVGADNVIAVRVNNAHDNNVAPLGGDYTQFGGIYRHVNLVATNKEHVALQEFVPADTSANPIGPTVSYWLHTPGVYLKPTNVTSSSANLAITTNLRNDAATARTLTVVSDIVDAEGNLVAELSGNQTIAAGANVNFVQNTTVSNPHLWNGLSDPYLYTVYVSVKEGSNLRDLVQHSLGFRSFSVNPNTGAMLNGSYYDLRGANFHQDRFNKGWAISEADQTEDVDLVQEMGSTFVRLAHYPHPQFTYDLLDQRGMAAWSEIPLNGTGNAGVTNTTAFLNNAKMQIQEMIRQNYNHPSVLVWGIYNELVDNADTQSVVTKLNALAKQEDPTRLTVCATDKAESSAINWITDITAFNKYFGWYGGSYDDMSWWPDAVHANYPTRAVGIGEYGAGAALTQHEDNPSPPAPFGQWHPEEYQNLFHEAYWKQLKTRPFIWSKLIWNMFDFAADGRDEGDTPGRNDKGMVTFDRQTRKDAFYFYKANWSDSPVLYISSRRYTNRPNNTVPVKIYANMDSVTLKVNGITVSTIDSSSAPDQIFQWNNVALQGGANTIEVTGTLGGQTYTDTVTWNAPGGGGAAWPTIPELTGTPFARINFQPDTTPGYVGYEQDYGYVFGSRPNGQSYGWDGDNTGGVRERTSDFLASPLDERYTRLNHMQLYGIYTWELAVPNGTYDVHLVAGDVSFIDSHYALNIEGRLALEGTPTENWPWIGSVVRVDVTDGRLTISNNAAGSNNKIAYIELNATAGTQPDVTPPTATYGGEQFIPGQAVFDFNVIYEDAGNIDASSLNGQDIRVTGPNGFDQVAEFQFIDSPDNGATRTVRYRISAPDGRWTIEDSGSYTFWQEPNQVRDVSGNYRPPDIIATLNPTFPFAYGFSNRFYVDFGDLPISLGMNGEGELTAISSSGTHSLSPALFDDILVTGTNAGNALTLLTTMPRPMTFIGNGGNDAMTVGAIASHTFDADISSTLPNLSLTVSGSVSFSSTQRLGALVIDGGSAVMSAGGNHILITDTLSISGGGTLDLADNDLVVNGGSFETIRDLVFQGFGNPAGPGITSSTSDGRQILALFDNSFTGASHWNGHAISPGAIVGMYTFMGDMNLDGIVTGDDYTVIDANLDTTPLPGSEWIRGDANLDGIITGDDYTVIDANLGAA